ncbi:MAG: flagellar protein FlgN [candidate division Zixibacteria bacterium]|nr:flagellar protein FlgN [candidate division Zixibacteria bacterium]
MINKLVEIIGKEAALFESFLNLLEQQRDKLVNNDTNGLNEINDRQREKIVESQILNKEREKLIEQIKINNSIEGDLTVSRLIELVDQNQAERLTQLREIIFELHDQISDVRNQNAMLVNRSREYISRLMNMLSKVNGPAETYSNTGTNNQTTHAVGVDRRV